jgi:hypothetical protein
MRQGENASEILRKPPLEITKKLKQYNFMSSECVFPERMIVLHGGDIVLSVTNVKCKSQVAQCRVL